MAKTPSSKNEPKFPVKEVDKKINDAYNKKEVERLKNLVARQDDQIIQMCDELNEFKKSIEESDEEISVLIGRIESYREILKTILEITE